MPVLASTRECTSQAKIQRALSHLRRIDVFQSIGPASALTIGVFQTPMRSHKQAVLSRVTMAVELDHIVRGARTSNSHNGDDHTT